jgi:hypothetical protein
VDLRHLHSFATVARTGSCTAAAVHRTALLHVPGRVDELRGLVEAVRA